MKMKNLPMKKALRAALFVLLLSVAGMTKGYAYDFSAVCETGQTLYYNITDSINHYVSLTYPGTQGYSYGGYNGWEGFTKPTGDVALPSSVNYDGVTYTVTSIGASAFYSCTNLTSIEIPELVTRIGNYAFSNCYGLKSITILAEYSPWLEGEWIAFVDDEEYYEIYEVQVFLNVNKDIPVYVPCGSLEAYQHYSDWDEFTNKVELCSGEITVSANPSEGGMVTGEGYYNEGDICVLTATSNPGFGFGNWMENGVVISTDSVFSFHAHPTNIVANFCSNSPIVFADANVKALCVANWDKNGDGELSYAEAAAVTSLGEVFRNNSTIVSFDELRYFIGLSFIGSSAFYNCTGLSSVIIPSSVTQIGAYAFSNCNGLESITVLAEYPPLLKRDTNPFSYEIRVFYNVNKSIPVYVPCGSLEAYQNAAGWKGFTNMIVLCSGEVIVTINPSEGGTVTGAGYYEGGELCVLTATPNPDFYFMNWMENGMVVSTDSVYSFSAHPTTIVANFCSDNPIVFADANVKALCVANWDTNGDEELSYAEAAAVTSLGTVFKNNTTITSFDELQCFTGLTSINNQAFYSCRNLTSIEIPNSVTAIGNYAFYHCSGLTSIEIPNAVTSIDYSAFEDCSGLTLIEIPSSVKSIGTNPFSGCSGLEQIVVAPGNTVYDSRDNCNAIIKSSTNALISGCKNTVIPNSVTSISSSAFEYCSGLTSVIIPNSVTSISSYAFEYCSGLPSVIIPNSVTFIAGTAFIGCSGLEQIIVEEGNPNYDSRENCNAIIETNTNTLVTGCKNTIIPNTVTSIGSYAFYSCSGLTSVNIPNSVTTIGSYSFEYCSGLTSITIPNTVTSIGSYAFYWCSGLTSLTIGNSVTSIGSYAFYDCSGLTSMTILADNPPILESTYQWGYYTYYNFYDVDRSIPVYVPCGAKEAYQNANGWKQFTNIRELCTQTQTTTLSYGWNWYSTYIEQEGIDGLSQLENSIGIPNVRIESQDGDYVRSKVRNGRTVWVGALTSINNEEMYKIGTKTACTATMEGIATDPALHPITINRGWNWIGFPCSESVSVSEALSGFSPKNNDMIKGRNGSATYSNGTWTGTLNTLEPGQGYMYGSKSNATKTLVFQTGSRGNATQANITPENNYYQPAEDYADNMTVIAVVELDGEELRSDDYELAAFVGDECRGSVKLMYVEPIDRYVAFLTVFGNEAEDLHFVLTDGATSDLSANHMTYATDGIEGTLDEPVVLRFGVTDVNENASVNVRIYPNPSEGLFNIDGQNIRKVEVFNAFGQLLYAKDAENGLMMIDLTNRASGIYLIRVVTDNGILNRQVMKR